MTRNEAYKSKAKSSFKTKLNLYLFENFQKGNQNNINIDCFRMYKIKIEMVDVYTRDFWQNPNSNVMAAEIKKWSIENKDIIHKLKIDYLNNYKNIFCEDEFYKLLNENSCHYCATSIETIRTLFENKLIKKKNIRGWELEIDRLDSNFEYTKDNCVMACYWCNNAKTDEFNETEFMNIGNEIKKIWEQRLKYNTSQ